MVSNGYVNSEPLSEIIRFIDAFNIDLKAFNNNFYRKLTGADIEPVKKALKQIAKVGKTSGNNHSYNSRVRMMMKRRWNYRLNGLQVNLGRDIPLHLSRYFPMYKRDDPATSQETLKKTL